MFKYSKAKLREGVTRIKDGIVNEFLIEGRDKAVLFDTGLDLFNIKEYVAIWMFTNPDCTLHEYADTGRRYYGEVKALGYTKYRGSHMPLTHNISFMRDYAEWVDKLTPAKALLQFHVPGRKSKLCIAVAPSAKHILFTSVYWAHQCKK